MTPAMRMQMLVGLVLVLAGCQSPPPEVDTALVATAQAADPGVTAAVLIHGRAILLDRCRTCHVPPRPSAHDAEAWKAWLAIMAPRARLPDEEHEDLLRYLIAASQH